MIERPPSLWQMVLLSSPLLKKNTARAFTPLLRRALKGGDFGEIDILRSHTFPGWAPVQNGGAGAATIVLF